MTSEALYKELHRNVDGFVRNRVNDPAVVDDIVQDIFLKAHSKLSDLKDDSRIGPWLFRIAHNTVIDHYRKVNATDLSEVHPIEHKSESDEELLRCVRTLINALPEEYREPLLMSDLKGKKQKDIAKKLNISHSGARSRVQRARKMVRERFESCCQHIINGEEHMACSEDVMGCPACDTN